MHDKARDFSESSDSSVPALVLPDSWIALGLKCCCNDIHIAVPVSQLFLGGVTMALGDSLWEISHGVSP